MPDVLLFIGAVGLTIVVTKGRIFAPIRVHLSRSRQIDTALLGELLSCSLCLGTWVGFLVGLLSGYGPVGVLACGGTVALLSWVMCGAGCSLELLVEVLRVKSGLKKGN